MKFRLLYILVFSISCLGLNAQSAKDAFEARKDIFLANNIYVVYTGNAVLDSAFKESFSKYWTIKPIKGFITKDEFKELIKDKGNSFFYSTDYHYSASGGGNHSSRSTTCIFAFNGGRKNTGKYNLMYESTSIQYYDAFGSEKDPENAAYRLPLIVTDFQHDINLKYDTSKKAVFVKEKILLVNENLVKGNKRSNSFQEGALAAWPWKYELMSPEKIASLIRARDSRYLLITPVLSDASAYIVVHDLASMKQLAIRGRSAIMGLPWVREKEMKSMVDALSELPKK
ncbi:MAG: hypothetical protein J7621_06845 [Niastella sp.]|nr:hypothetical protein [Niastella sp.]